ncbi:hypothetical protein I4U23_025535 [Adineta vaga]|nr:hypothetical protein I4U23_025535 [Adineta vaga]
MSESLFPTVEHLSSDENSVTDLNGDSYPASTSSKSNDVTGSDFDSMKAALINVGDTDAIKESEHESSKSVDSKESKDNLSRFELDYPEVLHNATGIMESTHEPSTSTDGGESIVKQYSPTSGGWIFIGIAQKSGSESMLKKIDTAFQQKLPPNTGHIINQYRMRTRKICEHSLVLLWKPYGIKHCEKIYRKMLMETEKTPDEYNKFDKEISLPYRSLMNIVFTVIQNIWDELQNSQSSIHTPLVIPNDTEDLKSIEDEIETYQTLFYEPMISHHAERAHTYKICCKKMETKDFFENYIVNLNSDLEQIDHIINVWFKELHTASTGDSDAPCQRAYTGLKEVMCEREKYLENHQHHRKDIIRLYSDAIGLKASEQKIIRAMANMTEKYCPDYHVFELLFNPSMVIICEGLIRREMKHMGMETYLEYDTDISKPFLKMIIEDWKRLAQVKVDMQKLLTSENDEAKSTVESNRQEGPAQLGKESNNLLNKLDKVSNNLLIKLDEAANNLLIKLDEAANNLIGGLDEASHTVDDPETYFEESEEPENASENEEPYNAEYVPENYEKSLPDETNSDDAKSQDGVKNSASTFNMWFYQSCTILLMFFVHMIFF